MDVEIEDVVALRFDDGSGVRAASAVTRLGAGWLVVQDDATHAAWWRKESTTRIRLLPPVDGHDVFSEAAGTKQLKPDLEAACEVTHEGRSGALVLGSGSKRARMRAVLVRTAGDHPDVDAMDVAPLYSIVADQLEIPLDGLNMEGACTLEGRLRWFNRGVPASGVPSGSVDLDLAALLAAVDGSGPVETVPIGSPRRYDIGAVQGVPLAVTDAVSVGADDVLLSAAAEDAPNATDDGPVVGTSLAWLHGADVVDVAAVPMHDGRVTKVEGLAVTANGPHEMRLLAVVDADDPDEPSLALRLRLRRP